MALRRRFSLVLTFALGCTSYAPRAELWPTVDAESGAGGDVPAGTGGAATSAGGGLATGGGGGAAGGDSTSGGGTISTGAGTGGGAGAIGTGGDGGAAGAGGRGGGAGAGGGPIVDAGPTGTCSLAVTVTTVTANGQYSPRNVGAIWISTDKDGFTKTLALWARQRVSRLTLWNSVTLSANLYDNTVDAVTGATLSSHQTHKVTWNCTNTSRTPVADGPYRVYFEMTDKNGAGPHMFVDFTKGPMPFNLSPPDQTNFKGINLVFTP